MTDQTFNYYGGLLAEADKNYYERVKYSNFIEEKKTESSIKFLDSINERKYYGFLDKDCYMVEPNAEVVSFGDYAGQVSGLNFVVSCFNNFRNYFMRKVEEGSLQLPATLGNLRPWKSFRNISINYFTFQRVVSQALIDPFITGRYATAPEMTFHGFSRALNEVTFDTAMRPYRVTKSGYVMSRYSTVYETGLYVDLVENMDPNVDYLKVDLVMDPGFQCFAEAANQFGFLIDQNCPWRLVLDLDSPTAQANILNNNMDRPFWDFYQQELTIRLGSDDYWNFQAFYKRMYLKYLQAIDSQPAAEWETSIPDEFWIRLYIITRLREIGEFSKVDFDSSDWSPTPARELYQNILTEALEKYRILTMQGLPPLTHNSGVILFVENECAKILKERFNLQPRDDSTDVRY